MQRLFIEKATFGMSSVDFSVDVAIDHADDLF